jgi:hypothetical protein
MLSKNE